MNRRNFIYASSWTSFGVLASSLPSLAMISSAEPLEEATITQLQEQMLKGTATSVSLTKVYMKRIRSIDQQGPALKSVIELNPDALSIAASMDKERKQGKIRGPLHGIPVLVKDNINTGDKMMTTAGSLALEGNIASEDAFIIQKLRAAGAVLLGKTNLSEWANFRSPHTSSGWSSRGGQTKNPYILDRSPSGSSAGSAVAVSANLCVVSIGTETDGSIVSPASANGVVGLKPTVGLLSRSGIIPISATQDTAGPMARTVTDAAILLGALTGVDPDDEVTKGSQGKSQLDYITFLDKNALKGKRIGVEKSHFAVREDLAQAFRKAIEELKAQGATIVEVELLKAMEPIGGNAEFTVLLHEFKDGLNRYLSGTDSKIRTLSDVIDFNIKNSSIAMPFFKQEMLDWSNSVGGLNSKDYQNALEKTLSSRQIITALMTEHQLDALAGITSGPASCIDLINGDRFNPPVISAPAAMAGFPHITVPMCQIHGLPAGLSFFSTAYTEDKLLAIAYAFEQATLNRKAPGLKKDVFE